MKKCPTCSTQYSDDTLQFCLQDGALLTGGSMEETPTVVLGETETVVARGGGRTEKKSSAIEQETRENVAKILEIEEAQKQERSITDRIADAIANFFGSMVFVWVHIVWFAGWILVNSVFVRYQFDPFPYTFLTLVVSLEAIFLSTFILISQNHETRITERRNHLDLQINLLAERENTKMLELLAQIAEKVGISIEDHDKLNILIEDIEPEKLIGQIKDETRSEKEKNNVKKANG